MSHTLITPNEEIFGFVSRRFGERTFAWESEASIITHVEET